MSLFQKVFNKIKNINNDSSVEIYAPVDGQIVVQQQIPDEAFSTGMLGIGLAIKPTSEKVFSPMHGMLTVAYNTGHAYVVTNQATQISVLLHLGVDTVNIDQKLGAFIKKVQQNSLVQKSTNLCEMKLSIIRQKAPSDLAVLLVQNENLDNKKIVHIKKPGEMVKAGDLLMIVSDK